MGEVIFSILVGGFLVIVGIIMNMMLKKEEKSWSEEEAERKS